MKYVYSGIQRRRDFLNKIKQKGFINKSSVLIIDGLNFFLRNYVANKSFNESGEHVGGLVGSILSLNKTVDMFKPSKILVIFDGKNGSHKRRQIYEEYKSGGGGIKNLSRIHTWADEKTQEENLINQINRFLDYLNYLPLFTLIQDDAEADDSIAFIAKNVYQKSKVIILSTDRDYLQLINDNISVYSPIKKILYNKEKFIEDYEIPPKNYVYLKMIEGDKSDGIPGIKGIGPKTLLKLSPSIIDSESYSIDNLLEDISKKYDFKGTDFIFNIRKQLERNYKLIQLSETILSNEQQLNVISQINSFKVPVLNVNVLKTLLMEDNLYTLSNKPSIWMCYQYLNNVMNIKRMLN